MTCEEFSNAFDVLLNSYKHKPEFGESSSLADLTLDEYEKSIFLTQAQDNVVKSHFTRTLNASGEGFDDSTKRQLDFSNLIAVSTFDIVNNKSTIQAYSDNGVVLNTSTLNALFIINEKIKTATSKEVTDTEGTKTEYTVTATRVVVPIRNMIDKCLKLIQNH